MPKIRPISDLRNKANEISEICHSSGEPVFITKNGESDLVVMSAAAYERDQARLTLYRLLEEAEDEVRKGDRGVPLQQMAKLRKGDKSHFSYLRGKLDLSPFSTFSERAWGLWMRFGG